MGVHKDTIDLIDRAVAALGVDYGDLSMLELGNQELRFREFDERIRGLAVNGRLPVKLYFTILGVDHVSIDLNGEDGALEVDLCEAVCLGHDRFDVVTNFGTSEHVYKQYECFWNIYTQCRSGGMMIHEVPLVGDWTEHICYYHYTEQFFKMLADACDGTVLELQTTGNRLDKHYNTKVIQCVMQKTGPPQFIGKEQFNAILSEGAVRG